MRQRFATLRALAATSGREAVRHSMAAYLGLAIVSVILFGGNGLSARRVIAICNDHPAFGACLFGAWVIFSLPATKTLLTHPKTQFLRSLPLSPGALVTALGICVGVIQLPWLVLWCFGAGCLAALAVTCLTVIATLVVLARGARLQVALLGCAGLALWASPVTALAVPVLAVAASLQLRDVWWRVPQVRWGSWHLSRWHLNRWGWGQGTPAVLQLALAYARTSTRSHGARVLRAFGYFVGAGLLSFLACSNLPPGETTRFPEVSLSLSAIFATATFVPPLLRTEHAARWVLTSTFTPHWLRRISLLTTSIGFTLCFTCAFGSLAHASLTPPAALHVDLTNWLSLAVSCAAVSVVGLRFAVRHDAADTRRVVLIVLGLAALAVLMTSQAALSADVLSANVLPCCAAALTILDATSNKLRALLRKKRPQIMFEPGPAVLRVIAVHKRFGARTVLCGASFECAPGEQLAIIGANGAGKSTLLQILTGQLEPDRGEVFVAGHALAGGAPEPRAMLGYVPDTSDALGDLSALEFVNLVRSLKGGARSDADAQLEQELSFPSLASRPMRELSLGQRKRVCLLAALFGSPSLLVLDEPSNGLDSTAVTWLVALLRERAARGQVNVFSTNDPAFLERTGAPALRLQDGTLVSVLGAAS